MRIDELGLNRFIEGLVAGQAGLCAAMLDHYLSRQTPVIDLYKYLFQPALYRIGELWKQNQISVSTEHMATAIIEGLMSELYPRLLTAPRRSLKAVIAFIEGELHQVGGKMVADVFVMNGWDVHYLGTNTPTSSKPLPKTWITNWEKKLDNEVMSPSIRSIISPGVRAL